MATDVVVCTWYGISNDPQEEVEAALTLGRRVSEALGAELRWLVIGPTPDQLGEIAATHGVAAVDRIDDPKLTTGLPDAFVEALAQYCAKHEPRLVVFNQNFDTRVVAPSAAGRLGAAVVMNCVDVEVTDDRLDVTAASFGGDTRMVYELDGDTGIVALLANAIAPEPAGSRSDPAVSDVAVDLSAIEERITVLQPAHAEGLRLEDAEIIVAGGRGLGSQENFALVEELAETLGGMAGASRPLVDDGWIDSSRQVGLTGKITRPALYLAAGISGATQHVVGCSAAKVIVAVNIDADAPIFRYARYGIVGDAKEVLPELIRVAKERCAPT